MVDIQKRWINRLHIASTNPTRAIFVLECLSDEASGQEVGSPSAFSS